MATTHQKTHLARSDLDKVLVRLCELIFKAQQANRDAGMVAACIIDPNGNQVYGINVPVGNKRAHAERIAIDRYQTQFGAIPNGSICVTTLSPCNRPMDERYGESCQDLLEKNSINKVYCGYKDPTQDVDTSIATRNTKIQKLCKKISDTFLKNTP